MSGAWRYRAAAALTAGALLLAGCSDDDGDDAAAVEASAQARLAADCAAAVDQLAATTQRYLDSIDTTSAASDPAAPSTATAPAPDDGDPAQQEEQFSRALSGLRAYAAELGCDPGAFRTDLGAALDRLDPGGPVSTAVLLQLQAESGTSRPPATVPPGGDVAAAVAAAPAGAVVSLEAGDHEVAETLVLLRGVTLRGAGRDLTTLRSAAPGGTVLVLTAEPVTLDAMTLARSDQAPGSVVSAAPVATLTVTGVRVTGATADAGGGGIGVLMADGGGQSGPTRRTSLRFVDSEAAGNAVAGVVVSGEHRAEVLRSSFDGNGQCGVCFFATSDGTVTDTRFTGNAVSLVSAGQARPALRTSTLEGGDVGVQALERSAPVVEGVTVSRAARAAVLFADDARGAVRGTTCTEVPVGIVVGPRTSPEVGDNPGCQLVRGQ